MNPSFEVQTQQLLDSEIGREELVEALVDAMHHIDRIDVEQVLRKMGSFLRQEYVEVFRELLLRAAAQTDVIVITDESPFWDTDSLDGLR